MAASYAGKLGSVGAHALGDQSLHRERMVWVIEYFVNPPYIFEIWTFGTFGLSGVDGEVID